jgi:hypothetical protein
VAGVRGGYLGTWVEGLANLVLSLTWHPTGPSVSGQLLGIEAQSDGSAGLRNGSPIPPIRVLLRDYGFQASPSRFVMSRFGFSSGLGNSDGACRRLVYVTGNLPQSVKGRVADKD